MLHKNRQKSLKIVKRNKKKKGKSVSCHYGGNNFLCHVWMKTLCCRALEISQVFSFLGPLNKTSKHNVEKALLYVFGFLKPVVVVLLLHYWSIKIWCLDFCAESWLECMKPWKEHQFIRHRLLCFAALYATFELKKT